MTTETAVSQDHDEPHGSADRPLSRRDFLKLGAALGMAGSFGSLLVGCATSSTSKGPDNTPGQATATAKNLPDERKVRELELYITTADYDPVRYEFGLMVAENWRKLGFAVKTTPLEWSRLSQAGNVEHEYDFYTLNWAGRAERIDPDFFCYMVLHSSQVGKGQLNVNGYQSKEYDQYAEAQRTTMDPTERKKAVFKCQEIFAKDQPHTPICTRNQLMPYNDRDWEGWDAMMGEGLNSVWNFVHVKPKTDRKTLKWGYPSDVTSLNPLVTVNTHDQQTLRLIYDRLMQIDDSGKAVNWLAESIKTVDDTHIEIAIRSGVKFHDGQPLTADDVKFSFEYPNTVKSPAFMGIVEPIQEVTVLNDHTVRFTLKRPFAPFFANCLGQVFILPKHIWQDVLQKNNLTKIQDYPNETPIGSGMFKIDYWRKNQEMKLSRNDGHWLKPAIDGIIKIPYANVQGMVAGVQSGEADFGGWWIEPIQIKQLAQSAPHVKVLDVRDHGYYHINYNLRRKPFDDVAVRMALAHAIPKQLIIDRLLEGHGELVDSFIAPANEAWHDPGVFKVEFNMDKAHKYLADAGYEWGPDGRIYYPAGKSN
jgi:peptide/nickel transport system substrate-binding protein